MIPYCIHDSKMHIQPLILILTLNKKEGKTLNKELELSIFDNQKPSDQQHLNEFHKAQINVSGDGVLSVNTEGIILLSDRVIRENLEISPGHHLKNHFSQLWTTIQDALIDKQRRTDIDIRKGELAYLVTVNPILSGADIIGAICVFSANTELETMTREMRAFKELSRELEAILDASSEGLWVCDGDGVVTRINKSSERINKLKAEEVVGKNMHELVESGIFDESVTLEVLNNKEVTNKLTINEKGVILIKTGRPVFDDEGKVVRVVVSERDITEIDTLRRKLDEQAAINDKFQHQIMDMQQIELNSTKIIAESPEMINALNKAIKVSSVDSVVLIQGESGVGKGLFADLIHTKSNRSKKPLIKINCGAIPETLIESELFGHEKGAFTGAQAARPGYLEMADGGVLFLDEIAELPLTSQVKLLRFLEDGQVTRLGATKPKSVDIRIIAATHRNLEEMVEKKEFRLDLYYRLNVILLHVPSLKERRECINPLTRHYIETFGKKIGKTKRITPVAMDILQNYDWAGNVRELMNICETLVVMTDTDLIDVHDLPQKIIGNIKTDNLTLGKVTLQQALDNYERSILIEAMKEHENQYKTATALGVNQSTIARKLKKYGLQI